MEAYNTQGTTTSQQEILKRDIINNIVTKGTEYKMTGMAAVVPEYLNVLDVKLTLPKTDYIEPETVSEGAVAGTKRLEWFNILNTMEKKQLDYVETFEAKARGLNQLQSKYTLKAVYNGFARLRDAEIFSTINAAVGDTNAASGLWNDDTTDIASDLAAIIGDMLDLNDDIDDADIPHVQVFYPKKLWGYLAKPIQVGEIQQTIKNWASREYMVSFHPAKASCTTTDALVVLKSELTATHASYVGKDVPSIEPHYVTGIGNGYLLTQYYKTWIMPKEEDSELSNKILKITDVCA